MLVFSKIFYDPETFNQRVTGSIPVAPTNKIKGLAGNG